MIINGALDHTLNVTTFSHNNLPVAFDVDDHLHMHMKMIVALVYMCLCIIL